MLLAAQMTFGWRQEEKENVVVGIVEKPIKPAEDDSLTTESDNNIVIEPTVINPTHTEPVPSETPLTALGGDITAPESQTVDNLDQWNKMIETAEKAAAEPEVTTVEERVAKGETYIDGLGQEVVLEADLPQDESKKKTYMIKDPQGQLQTKNR